MEGKIHGRQRLCNGTPRDMAKHMPSRAEPWWKVELRGFPRLSPCALFTTVRRSVLRRLPERAGWTRWIFAATEVSRVSLLTRFLTAAREVGHVRT